MLFYTIGTLPYNPQPTTYRPYTPKSPYHMDYVPILIYSMVGLVTLLASVCCCVCWLRHCLPKKATHASEQPATSTQRQRPNSRRQSDSRTFGAAVSNPGYSQSYDDLVFPSTYTDSPPAYSEISFHHSGDRRAINVRYEATLVMEGLPPPYENVISDPAGYNLQHI